MTNFIDRIYDVEIPPPAAAWENIAAELNKLPDNNFIRKLSQASVAPPAEVWNKLVSVLDGRKPARLFALNSSRVKWIAAALITGLIVLSASYLFRSGRNMPSSIAKKEGSAAGDTSQQHIPLIQQKKDSQAAEPITELAQNVEQFILKKKAGGIPGKRTDHVRYATIENAENVLPTDNNIAAGNPVNANVPSSAGSFIPAPDYFVVTAPNGQRVRISSKFSDAVNSLFAGDNSDNSWKTRFDSWKSKLMSNPSFIPAAGNFLDIVELKDLLKEQ